MNTIRRIIPILATLVLGCILGALITGYINTRTKSKSEEQGRASFVSYRVPIALEALRNIRSNSIEKGVLVIEKDLDASILTIGMYLEIETEEQNRIAEIKLLHEIEEYRKLSGYEPSSDKVKNQILSVFAMSHQK